MKKIFINPEVRVLFVEPSMNCMSGVSNGDGIGCNVTTDGTSDDNGFNENQFAPVRMDIFNYGGLQ